MRTGDPKAEFLGVAMTDKRLVALRNKFGITRAASQVLDVSTAKAYGEAFFRDIKVPNMPDIPFKLPTELSVDAIERAAYDTARTYAEGLMESKLGVKISLPKKLTVKEVLKTADSLIPDDAREALDVALTVGTQVVAGAVSSALTGVVAATAIGSAIPGLGTVIGLGVGLATVAIRGVVVAVFTESACERNKALCKCKTPKGWVRPDPGQRSAVELLPWLAIELAKLDALKLSPELCSLGKVPETKAWFRTLSRELFPIVATTLPYLSLPALERLLPQYEAAAQFSTDIRYGKPRSVNAWGIVTPGTPSLLDTIRNRIAALKQLSQRVFSEEDVVGTLGALGAEMYVAANQCAFNPSDENYGWLSSLTVAYSKFLALDAKRKADIEEVRKQDAARGAARYASPQGPLWKVYNDLSNAAFACDGGSAAACKQISLLELQAVELRRQGMRLPPHEAPAGSLFAIYEAKTDELLQRNFRVPTLLAPARRSIWAT